MNLRPDAPLHCIYPEPGKARPGVPVATRSEALRSSQTYRQVVQLARSVYPNRPQARVLSTGEQCAVALLLDDATCLPHGYTFLQAVDRLEGEWLAACIQADRDGWRE